MTKGVMTPLPPLHRLSTASLTSVRIASLFSLFSFAIFFGSTKRIFPDSGVPWFRLLALLFSLFSIAASCRVGATLAFCWAHLRRKFFDIAKEGNAPTASEALDRIAKLYLIEKPIRGHTTGERPARPHYGSKL